MKIPEWMTNTILELMKERSQYKNRNNQKYKELLKRVLRVIRKTKQRYLSDKCAEIEILQAKHDNLNIQQEDTRGRIQE